MSAIAPGTPLQLLSDVLRTALAQALSQNLGSPWTVELQSGDAPAEGDSNPIWFGLILSGKVQGNAAIQFRTADALLLGQKLAKETPDAAAEFSPARRQAVEGLLKQFAESFTVELKAKLGDINVEVASIEAPSWEGTSINLAASETSAAAFPIQLRVAQDLLLALASQDAPPSEAASGEALPAEDQTLSTGKALDLLLGVNLNVILRFGKRTLTLREVFDLSSGAVVEMDKKVQEPGDLILGDKVIARGEVVIVDGNYGLRVTELCDVNDNLATGLLAPSR